MGSKKALLIQLPVPSARWPRADANIPLASGYLAACALQSNPDWSVEILPWEIADIYGDEPLIRAILEREPQIVGFSLYLWNSERSAAIAKRLKGAGIFTVGGGPEVDPTNVWLVDHEGFDLLIEGEGEAKFSALLSSFPKIPLKLPDWLLDLSNLPSPYLSGVLPPFPDGSAWLETVRGCPFSCDYCNYGKRFASIRKFPQGWLASHLEWFRERGANEIYLMDPSFNVRDDWEEILSALEKSGGGEVFNFHSELAAEHLRAKDAAKLAAAGFRSVEVGLQSADKSVLALVNRKWDRRKWLSRMRELSAEGITASVGIIAGLPGDTLETFEATLSFLLTELPGAEIQLFPLAVLPGTALRQRAEELGLSHFSLPPYTVFDTPSMSAGELRRAFSLFEEATGHELDPMGNPAISGEWSGGEASPCLTGAKINAGAKTPSDWPEKLAARAAVNFTLYLEGWREGLESEIARFADLAPNTVLTVAIEGTKGGETEITSKIRALCPTPPYLRRHYSHLCADLFPRVAFLLPHTEAFSRRIDAIRERAEVMFTVKTCENWEKRSLELAKSGENLFIKGPLNEFGFADFCEKLGEDAEGVIFSDESAQRKFLTAGGRELPLFAERRITI